ncbi:CdaR family transcriptional regulator [Brevibacillus choshinensis]|uniref:Helix-turn-helix domain-containing protein n=1 Tax=Brevibacillus choshinensis TaxID=54911 RepID=A0ABX7FQS8_BRECH|nr:sugar diacid recognition domain-containing protein [Brevibacillus choshinensis]QRG68078.1 helix-turn-helix domain-containing protein [Brevibacillus choshinensis]
MKLKKFLADKIVSRTMEVTQLNINVMDKDGIIISSSDDKRINTFHEAARQVIASGEEIVLTASESRKWTGTRPGINMPIFFDTEIVGVIGISGSPREVIPFGKAVRMMTEMMLQQAYLTEQMAMEERSLNFLIQDIISGTLDPSPAVVQSRGELLGLDLSGPRSIIIVQAAPTGEWTESPSRRKWLSKMAACFYQPQQVCISAVSHNRWIIVTDLRHCRSHQHVKQYLSEAAQRLRTALSPILGDSLLITMGNRYDRIRDLEHSFKEAQQTLQVIESFPEKGPICHFDDATLELMLIETPGPSRKRAVEQILGTLVQHPELMDTLQALFSSDLNLTNAALRLNIHRNTLLYRLERIEAMLGKNPRSFADAFRIQLALEMHRLGGIGYFSQK